jgi:hypothetical protein
MVKLKKVVIDPYHYMDVVGRYPVGNENIVYKRVKKKKKKRR